MSPRLGAVAAGLLAALSPALARACAVCGAAVDRNQNAFLGSTILLSLLPLALIGGGLWWLARHARERLAGEFEDRDAAAESTASGAGYLDRGRGAARPGLTGAAHHARPGRGGRGRKGRAPAGHPHRGADGSGGWI